jgi:type IV pilus assembly protein PilV
MNNQRKRSSERGITLVESLVALVVLSVGMLGIASLYISSLKAGRSALVRTQAVNLATDIADRIRANRDALAAYDTGVYGGAPEMQGCLGADCTPEALAEDDLARWLVTMRTVMPGNATGQVIYQEQPGLQPDQYTVIVSWLEQGEDARSDTTLVVEL